MTSSEQLQQTMDYAARLIALESKELWNMDDLFFYTGWGATKRKEVTDEVGFFRVNDREKWVEASRIKEYIRKVRVLGKIEITHAATQQTFSKS